ncbi:ABC transporter permease [Pseudoalteromonas phenolica]|uniref:ABC transporter permease n=1 Tax=Pseudoalteromonas phenolica TaxID=161398 RepID=UPI00110BC7E8|nr:FtsX-like permease family protein [Pseudoalteromonas phenolica]TMN90138.1 ABC transporter permease [Pseudoalteromonas phenolica]
MSLKHILKLILKQKSISILIVFQVAITLMIVSNSAFISYATLQNWLIPSKLEEQQILNVVTHVYDEQVDKGQLIERDLTAIRALPEVVSATHSGEENVIDTRRSSNVVYNDSLDENAKDHSIALFGVDQQGVESLMLNISSGRDFYANEFVTGDATTTPASVALISDDLAKTLFEEASPLGQTVYLNGSKTPYQVVGTFEDKMLGESATYEQVWYHGMVIPEAIYGRNNEINYIIRVAPNTSEKVLETIETLLYQEPGRIVSRVEFSARAKKRLWDGRSSFAFVMFAISAVALLITSLGIIALVTFSVKMRHKNLGILRALGASKSMVLKSLIIENSLLALVGLVIGFFLSLWLNMALLQTLGVQGTPDIVVGILVTLFVWLLTCFAAYLPARKATLIAPAQVTKAS